MDMNFEGTIHVRQRNIKNCLQLTCPTAVFYSEEDKLSSVLDVLDLIDQLPNVVFTVRFNFISFTSFGPLSFTLCLFLIA